VGMDVVHNAQAREGRTVSSGMYVARVTAPAITQRLKDAYHNVVSDL